MPFPLPAIPATHYTRVHRSAFFPESMRAFIGLPILVAVYGSAVADSPQAGDTKDVRVQSTHAWNRIPITQRRLP